MKRRDLIRYLGEMGCELLREGGSHSIWKYSYTNRQTAVPRHREISYGMTCKICRDLGIEVPEGSR